MEQREPEGYWCDVCHQLHYQVNPDCLRRRHEKQPDLKALIAAMVRIGVEDNEQPDRPVAAVKPPLGKIRKLTEAAE